MGLALESRFMEPPHRALLVQGESHLDLFQGNLLLFQEAEVLQFESW